MNRLAAMSVELQVGEVTMVRSLTQYHWAGGGYERQGDPQPLETSHVSAAENLAQNSEVALAVSWVVLLEKCFWCTFLHLARMEEYAQTQLTALQGSVLVAGSSMRTDPRKGLLKMLETAMWLLTVRLSQGSECFEE